MTEIKRITDINALLDMRMEVLDCVFEHPDAEIMRELRDANRKYYLEHLADGSHIAAFAYVDGKLAGSGAICLYQEMPSPDNPSGRCAYIMNMYVRPQYRHHGIASEMIHWLIEEAKKAKADKIYLEATDMAVNLYDELGFHEMQNMMKYEK